MDSIEILIQNTVGQEYSCIQEGDVVIVPCYLITPLEMSGLRGNGNRVNHTLQCEICLFVETRKKAVEMATILQEIFLKNQYACTDPRIEYEKNAKAWKIIFLAEGIIERNEIE